MKLLTFLWNRLLALFSTALLLLVLALLFIGYRAASSGQSDDEQRVPRVLRLHASADRVDYNPAAQRAADLEADAFSPHHLGRS